MDDFVTNDWIICFFPSFYCQLSAQAIKDYNRGRAYLKEFAKSSGVPVYECISQAVHRYLGLASRKNVNIS